MKETHEEPPVTETTEPTAPESSAPTTATAALLTEQRNPHTMRLDALSTEEMLGAMHEQDLRAHQAVGEAMPQIATAVELMTRRFSAGGRIIYAGSGTSGRLGRLEAYECPLTFGVEPERVLALVSGAVTVASHETRDAQEEALIDAALAAGIGDENGEDSPAQGAADLCAVAPTSEDVVIGISASGRTPYVLGVLEEAARHGCGRISVACNPDSAVSQHAEVPIELVTGPEVLTGSTRLSAGTACKMALNMLSTATMIKTGKVYENLMVDLRIVNGKLVDRAMRILEDASGVPREACQQALEDAQGEVKLALVMLLSGRDISESREALKQHSGQVRQAVSSLEERP